MQDDAGRPTGRLSPAEHAITLGPMGGLQLIVSPHLDRHTRETLLGVRPFEQTEFGLAAEILEAGQTVLDIGAGSAAWSLWAATLGARVEAYEPSPLLCNVAQSNLDVNRVCQIDFHPGWAVVPSHQSGPVNLVLPGGGYDAAYIERAARVVDSDLSAPWLESAERLVQRVKPDVVFVEASGMAAEIALVIASIRRDRPRTLIARMRPDLEGEERIRSAVQAIRSLGYSLRVDKHTMLWDGWVFEC